MLASGSPSLVLHWMSHTIRGITSLYLGSVFGSPSAYLGIDQKSGTNSIGGDKPGSIHLPLPNLNQ